MKIAFFTDNFYPQPSGVATSVGNFVRELEKKGHTVYVFAPKVRGFKEKETNVFRIPSVRVIPNLPDGARIPLPLPDKNMLKIVSVDFDLVHAHGNGAFSLLGLLVARSKKVPYIQTFHIQVSQFAQYFFKGKIIKPKTMNTLFLKKFASLCNGIISPSLKMQQELIDNGIKKEIEIIPNFVELDKFKNTKSGVLHKKYRMPKNTPIILSAGRVGKEKNFYFLTEVFVEVAKENKDVHLVIAGPDWGEFKKIRRLAAKNKLSKRIHLMGAVGAEKMPEVYADADIFVFPSTSEVHPMVAIEAAASSLPLIVCDDKAYEGIVFPNQNGFKLALNKKTFADKISLLLQDKEKRHKWGQKSRQIIEKQYNPKFLTEKLTKYYSQILSKYHQTKKPQASKPYVVKLWVKLNTLFDNYLLSE